MPTGGKKGALTGSIEVLDDGELLAFTFDDMLRYSGPGSPAGVALAFKAMEYAFAVLSPGGPPQRRAVTIDTAFRGPGARDGFELVTRGLTEGRYVVDADLERPERGPTLEQFVFRLSYGDGSLTLLVREGQVADEFVVMARRDDRTPEDERDFAEMKRTLAERLMARPAGEAFEVDGA
jgi:hypothetical protein